jgi:hypothetical protein
MLLTALMQQILTYRVVALTPAVCDKCFVCNIEARSIAQAPHKLDTARVNYV